MMTDAPFIGSEVSRWPAARSARRLSIPSWGGAMLLHVAVGAAGLMDVHLAVTPAPSGDHAIALAFAPHSDAPPPSVPNPPDPTPAQAPDAPSLPATSPLPPPLPAPIPPPPLAVTTAEPPPSPMPPRPPPKRPPVQPRPVASVPAHPAVAAPAYPPAPALFPTLAGDPATARPAAPAPIAADWQHALSAWLFAHKTYPDEARRAGAQGSVVLRFTVDRSGHVLDVQRLDTGAPPVLGAAAAAMLRGATLPPFPDTMPQDRVTITVRVHYALTD